MQTYGYDEIGRLLSAARTSVTETFGYDGVGNRTSYAKTGQATQTFSYGTTNNRLLSSSQPRLWTYDANGNSNGYTGSDGVAVGLHYDAFGRIDSSSRNSQSTIYLVNALGQRVSKAGPNGTTRFVYSPDGGLLAEYKAGTGWTNYIRANGEVHGLIRGNTLYYVHSDQVARPEVVTNAAKATVWTANNYAFERTVASDTIGGLNIGFPGQYFDQETGLWQNYFRDYDPSTGRYIQSDPIGLGGGLNTYSYVSSGPVRLVDPLGLDSVSLEFFAGWGGGVTVYFDRDSKGKFQFQAMSLKIGVGEGAGISYDPQGERPDKKVACNVMDSSLGLYASGGIGIPAISIGGDVHAGVRTDAVGPGPASVFPFNGYFDYGGGVTFGFDGLQTQRFGASGNAGLEVTFP